MDTAMKDDPWFVREDDGRVVVDPDLAYPRYLRIIDAKKRTVKTVELARKVLTEDLKQTLGTPLHLQILAKDRSWALRNFRDESGHDEALVRNAAGQFEQFYKALPGTPAMRVGLI